MNKITLGVLLALSFSGYAATEQVTSKLIDSFKIESNFHFPGGTNTLNVHQNVTVYSFNAKSIAAIKKTLAEIEQKGFSTATASLSGLEENQNSTIMVFRANKKGQSLSPLVLSEALQKTVSSESKSGLEGIMPERLYTQIDNVSLSVVNTALGKFYDGRIVLTQFISANNDGKEIATHNKLRLPEKGAILNIIKIKPENYILVLTTI
ncbi:hypothetical protein [Citrobacter freundii]|uniref:hypothetical protein n=1 Tax=Citrobacter freundii TaxID=546 RepID=UPI000E1D463A|nr:hypothetical protein [Citrobacter freundii]RDU15068.1 hypothetical protein DWV02_23170 [Citrobacter freundii]